MLVVAPRVLYAAALRPLGPGALKGAAAPLAPVPGAAPAVGPSGAGNAVGGAAAPDGVLSSLDQLALSVEGAGGLEPNAAAGRCREEREGALPHACGMRRQLGD